MTTARELAERVGAGHDPGAMREARRRARATVGELARDVRPGMAEEEALALARRRLREHGFAGDWAAPCVRFGVNTLKPYGEPSEPGTVLGHDDVWYVDVGPLWRGHESDYADSFAVGGDPERQRLVRDARGIFERTAARWRASRATGVELYRYAAAEASACGWHLDSATGGHRLGLHPHAAWHDGPLSEAGFTPSPGLWMLEIFLRHPRRPYAAFYEDLLLDDPDAA